MASPLRPPPPKAGPPSVPLGSKAERDLLSDMVLLHADLLSEAALMIDSESTSLVKEGKTMNRVAYKLGRVLKKHEERLNG